jgi:hypothetical protein
MTREASYEQISAIYNLKEGDTVKLTNGQNAEFVKAKQKKFVGIIDGKPYDIPFTMFQSLVEKTSEARAAAKQEEKKDILSTIKKGDWFYINKNGNAIAFKYEGIEGKRIIGVNPINNAQTRIDMNFEIGLLK